MRPTARPRIKICCIQSLTEARLAIRLGADALGLVSEMPSGPGVITERVIRAIARRVPPPIATFLLTSRRRVADVVTQVAHCGTNTVQLCDRLVDGTHRDLRRALPGVSIVQVVHVTGREAIDEALAVAPEVDALLLDSGNQGLSVKELGGTGRTHDWETSAEIRRVVRVPVFLAGGLHPGNVAEARAAVGPWGFDVCSGTRTAGRLDRNKLAAFVAACRS